MNWNELKDFCNSLPPEELEKNVILWREDAEDVITDISASQLSEDQYVDNQRVEEGCFDESEALSQIKTNPEDFPNGLADFTKVHDKGRAILHENF